MRLEKGSKRCVLVVAVGLFVFFALLGVVEDMPGEDAAIFPVVIVSRSNILAFWQLA